MKQKERQALLCREAFIEGKGAITVNVNWFKEPEHVVYVEAERFLPEFSRKVKLPDLPAQVEAFRAQPAPEGKNIRTGMKGTSLKLFVPDLVFEEKLDMGDTVWVYLGQTHVSYCLYWKQ